MVILATPIFGYVFFIIVKRRYNEEDAEKLFADMDKVLDDEADEIMERMRLAKIKKNAAKAEEGEDAAEPEKKDTLALTTLKLGI